MDIDNVLEMSMLYDFYGALLKEHKCKILEDYILNDYSLSEIAQMRGMTRQGVYDTIKRTSKELRNYENSLLLIDKFQKIENMVNQIQETIQVIKVSTNRAEIRKIEELSMKILEEI